MPKDKPYYTIRELAETENLHWQTVYRWVQLEQVKAEKNINGVWIIPKETYRRPLGKPGPKAKA